MAAPLKIASWNINSVRFRLASVQRFLAEEQPDILCLQETKVINNDFPEGPFRQLGYNFQKLHGQPMHHGVAIISKMRLSDDNRLDWQANGEARHIGVSITGPLGGTVRLENVYVPAGGEIPDRDLNPKFGQKLDFLERMTQWSRGLDGRTIILGDFNIAPLESDVWSHKQLINTVSHTAIEIERLKALQDAHGWVDIGRKFYPAPQRLYTWWSYRARDWSVSDKGRRLDHIWVSPDLVEAVKSHRVVEPCRGWAQPSDHAPLISEFLF
ncbi:MAG: exodeoxyribonuclease III [Sphingomonadales bacterium RIFCSPHIGHO2_01_FULL_65_20]|jgi:exodeoxyribonuclease-3|uniref:exodeoxyribonuclease III n=1 Tax=Blastomonas TaxID=150203 RepID=UPI0008339043|nr:exodeoxyribonuclease III [Sphingomonas ursincola]MBA4778434.1 exodeoxyribonuclease III [Blastomonas sp.]MBY0618720.1 exodeoxyribonuclease III [Sphingomonas ursincola]MCH2237575.1 exodeoxyribonuclease III [Blastomonas sp.]OHC96928.1 MAG: exodeoxyribonuclease III [Sphingomonadales bacterium RIFCSPHIGHO2_01_FULL_65_20]